MKPSGFLRGLAVKALVVGTALGIGISTAAAAGVLPGASQSMVADAVHSFTPWQLPGTQGGATASPNLGVTDAGAGGEHAGTDAGLSTGAASSGSGAAVTSAGSRGGQASSGAGASGTVATGARANAGASGPVAGVAGSGGVNTGVGTNPVHLPLTIPTPNVVSTISSVKSALNGCLSSVVNPTSGLPLVAAAQVLPMLEACVKNVVGALPLPPAVSSCASGLFNSLGGLPVLGSPPSTSIGITGIAAVPGSVAACASSIVAAVLNLVSTVPAK